MMEVGVYEFFLDRVSEYKSINVNTGELSIGETGFIFSDVALCSA